MLDHQSMIDNPAEYAQRLVEGWLLPRLHHRLIALSADPEATHPFVEMLELAGLDPKPHRTLNVRMRLPSRQDMIELIEERGSDVSKEIMENFYPYLERALDKYFDGSSAKPWKASLQHGNATIELEGIPHDSKEPEHQSVLKGQLYLDDEERKAHMGDVCVNGRIITGFRGATFTDHIGALAELTDTMNRIDASEADPKLRFGREVSFSPNSTMAILPDRTIRTGHHYFSVAKTMDASFHESILLHEKGHIVHKDLMHSPPMEMLKDLISSFIPLREAFEKIDCTKTGAAALLLAHQGDLQAARLFAKRFSEYCTIADRTITPLLEHLHLNPMLAKGDALEIAQSLLSGDDALQNHISSLNTLSGLNDLLPEIPRIMHRLTPMTNTMTQSDKVLQRAGGSINADHIKMLEDTLAATLPAQQSFCTKVKECEQLLTAFSHAEEFMCDIYAVEHAERPELVSKALAALHGYILPDYFQTFSSHPDSRTRNTLLSLTDFTPEQLDQEAAEFDALPAAERQAFAISVGAIAADETDVDVRFLPLELAMHLNQQQKEEIHKTHPADEDRAEFAEDLAEALGFPDETDTVPSRSFADSVRPDGKAASRINTKPGIRSR